MNDITYRNTGGKMLQKVTVIGRLTKEENDLINAYAKKARQSRSAFMVLAALDRAKEMQHNEHQVS